MSNFNFDDLEAEEDYEAEDFEAISFHAEDVDFPFGESRISHLTDWVVTTVEAEGFAVGIATFIFCSDAFLLQINKEYLEHDYYTDIITFPYHEDDDEEIEGDMYISVERTAENAATMGVAPLHELCRVIIHGTLHLCGYDDETPELRQAMHEKENFYLAKLAQSGFLFDK